MAAFDIKDPSSMARSVPPLEAAPPYTENPILTGAPNSSTTASDYSPNAASTAALPTYNTSTAFPPSSTRLLHIYYSGIMQRNMRILSPDKTTVLYTIKTTGACLFGSKPHVTVCKADTGAVIGTVTFHSLSRKIDMVVHGNPVALTSQGLFTSAHDWTSVSAMTAEKSPMRFTWKNENLYGNRMVCFDEQRREYARFDATCWALQKAGKFEISPLVNEDLLDEFVVAGVAMLELKRRTASAAAGAGVA